MATLTELGYEDAARPRDFFLRWRVGSFVNPDDFAPRLSAPYRTVVGEIGPDKKVAEENLKLGNKPQLATYGGSYTYSARMGVICGVDAKFPKAEEALRWFEANLPNLRHELTRDPVFALSPRKTKGPE